MKFSFKFAGTSVSGNLTPDAGFTMYPDDDGVHEVKE